MTKAISENSKKITEERIWNMEREEIKIERIIFCVNTFGFSFPLEIFQIIFNS